MSIIFLDFETTGLLRAQASNLDDQPKAIEFYGLRLDDNLEFISEFETFIFPSVKIPEHITKLTGIDDKMVEAAPSFPFVYDKICDLFLGAKTVVAHNAPFDMGIMWVELSRMDKEFNFPWPPERICTVEKSYSIKNRRLKLSDLHEMMTGEKHKEGAHRAKHDVFALVRCYKGLKERGLI